MNIDDDDGVGAEASKPFNDQDPEEPADPSDEERPNSPPPGALGERRTPRQLWLISYSDFMTILMIFFLAMYGYTYLAKVNLLKSNPQKYARTEFSARMNEMKQKLGKQLVVKEDVDKVTLQLSDKILFASGSAALNREAIPTLEDLAKSVKLMEGEVIVSGHTDDVPVVGGRFKSNWELSAARAFSVIQALTKAGLSPQRLAAWGFGENRPVVPNTSAENRAENRRIEVIILKKKEV